MVGLRKQGERVRQFILDNVEEHPEDIARYTSDALNISSQAVNKHLQLMVKQQVFDASGATRNRRYRLHPQEVWERSYAIDTDAQEDVIWRTGIFPVLGALPGNVIDIWQFGVTEMLNNAIHHSAGSVVHAKLTRTAGATEIWIHDDGVGIFKKVQQEMGLLDERHSVLELAKGKFTTDPQNHTGEGIFFSSRMFDKFTILSGEVYFSHSRDVPEDWILQSAPSSGTSVWMVLKNNTAQTSKAVFDEFASEQEEYGFTRTIVPVELAQYGDAQLISRSQAKRLLVRIDRFKTVVMDFEGVETIGQSFADEIFRVFHNQHPGVELIPINTIEPVDQMIRRALHYS